MKRAICLLLIPLCCFLTVLFVKAEEGEARDNPYKIRMPEGAVEFNRHYYKVFYEQLDWKEARDKCRAMGGHLVTITSKEEQEFIDGLNVGNVWLGAVRKDSTTWEWVTGESLDYVSPENWRLTNEESSNVDGFICEWDNAAGEILWNQHRYLIFDYGLTWLEAKDYCEFLGGHLVTITSQEEQEAIELLMEDGQQKQYWIGMSLEEEGMIWMTGEELNYTNWDYDEPNHMEKEGREEKYVHILNEINTNIYGSRRFKWNDIFEDNRYPGEEYFFDTKYVGFICEFDSPMEEIAPGRIYREGRIIAQLNKDLEDYVLEHPSMSEIVDYDLAYYLCTLAFSTYEPEDIYRSLENLAFEQIYVSREEFVVSAQHKAGFVIARKPLADGKTMVLISVRGTQDGGDWNTDFGMGAWTALVNGKHEGFMISVQNILRHLKLFLKSENLAVQDIVYVITGHSLGAGVANLLAVELSDEVIGVDKNNVYSYTFATPNVAKKWPLDFNSEGIHNNIKNFCNYIDIVPKLPSLDPIPGMFVWGKFGITKWFVAIPSVEGFGIIKRHVAHILANHMDEAYIGTLRQYKSFYDDIRDVEQVSERVLVAVKCPVDVYLYEGEELKASVIDGVGQTYNTVLGEIIVLTDGQEKYFLLPPEVEYRVHIVATDQGEMTYSVGNYDLMNREIVDEVIWESVALEAEKEFVCDVGGETEKEAPVLYELISKGGESPVMVEVPQNSSEVPPASTEETTTAEETTTVPETPTEPETTTKSETTTVPETASEPEATVEQTTSEMSETSPNTITDPVVHTENTMQFSTSEHTSMNTETVEKSSEAFMTLDETVMPADNMANQKGIVDTLELALIIIIIGACCIAIALIIIVLINRFKKSS